MTRLEAWCTHVATILVGGTGLVYAWMRYLAMPADPDALIAHPWQPAVQHLHVLTAPLLVFAVGLLWRRHIWFGLRWRPRERLCSGLVLAAALLPMVASGYLLQTAVEPGWRQGWVVVHCAASGLWILGYAIHQISPRPAANGQAVDASGMPDRNRISGS
jgi:hypothetical protein